VARATGSSRAHFEAVAAWSPALLGAAGVVPVAVLGMTLRSLGVGLGAAAIYALLPIAINYSRVGNADHHAAAGLLGALLLALYALALDERTRGAQAVAVFAALCLVRTAMLGVWTGSLLYLAPGEAGPPARERCPAPPRPAGAQAWSAAATAALVAPVVWLARSGRRTWSATELSRLHPRLRCHRRAGGRVLAWRSARPRARRDRPRARGGLALGLGARSSSSRACAKGSSPRSPSSPGVMPTRSS
jgi:hypothetical protein